MLSLESLSCIGKIIGTTGYMGKMRLLTEDRISVNLKVNEVIFFKINNKPVPYFINSVKPIGENLLILGIDYISSKDEALEFIDTEVFLNKELINYNDNIDEDLSALTGYALFDNKEECIGNVTGYIDNSGQILLEVNTEKKNILIPLDKDLLINIDHNDKIIIVNLPEGLLDI